MITYYNNIIITGRNRYQYILYQRMNISGQWRVKFKNIILLYNIIIMLKL